MFTSLSFLPFHLSSLQAVVVSVDPRRVFVKSPDDVPHKCIKTATPGELNAAARSLCVRTPGSTAFGAVPFLQLNGLAWLESSADAASISTVASKLCNASPPLLSPHPDGVRLRASPAWLCAAAGPNGEEFVWFECTVSGAPPGMQQGNAACPCQWLLSALLS